MERSAAGTGASVQRRRLSSRFLIHSEILMSTCANTRREVVELLKKTAEIKVQRAAYDDALDLAEQAYSLAQGLHAPWPQLAAYRLAQLLLRERRHTVEDLQRINALFETASRRGTHLLGPLPQVYRIAVLHRLSQMCPDQNGRYRAQMEQAYNDAIDAQSFPGRVDRETSDCFRIQTNNFNLVELAAFGFDLPYERLLGLGTRGPRDPGLPNIRGGWVLLSQDPKTAMVRYSRAFAENELASLLEVNPQSIAFRFDRGRSEWKKGADATWTNVGENTLRWIAHLLQSPGTPPREQANDLSLRAEWFRQVKRRAKLDLCRILNDDSLAPFRDNRLQLPVPIYGIAELEAVRWS